MAAPHRATPLVLVVEDDAGSRRGLVELLEDSGYAVASARDGEEALARVARDRPDLIVSDICMPGTDGIEMARQLRASAELADTALILVSALGATDRRVLALDVGADDFLQKPIVPEELLARVRAHLRRARRHSDAVRMSVVDPLTGALNRRGVFETLAAEVGRARAGDEALSVLLVDVDDFKAINDTHGHAAGDEVLRRLASLLRGCVRHADGVGRLGGDELVVLLPRADAQEAARVAGRITGVQGPDGGTVTVSVGAATLAPGDAPDTLVARADAAMYDAKRAGRDRPGVRAGVRSRTRRHDGEGLGGDGLGGEGLGGDGLGGDGLGGDGLGGDGLGGEEHGGDGLGSEEHGGDGHGGDGPD